MSTNYIRGGQITLHQFRMFKQVFTKSLSFALVIGVLIIAYRAAFWIDKVPWHKVWDYGYAHFNLMFAFGIEEKVTQTLTLSSGKVMTVRSKDVLNNRHYQSIILALQKKLWDELYLYGLLSVALFTLLTIGLSWWGLKQHQKQHTRGRMLVPASQLRRRLKLQFQASPFRLANVPMVKHSETKHILFCGTTGSGKTTAMFQLLNQLRKRNHRAVVVDTTGSYVKHFYKEGHDILLNPLDKRSVPWHFWAECLEEPHYEEVASSCVQGDTGISDSFWLNASRVVVAELLRKMHREGKVSNQELARHLFFDKLPILEQFLKETCAARLTTQEAEKMTIGILAQYTASLQVVRYLPDTEGPVFSLRQWVQNESSNWVFLTSKDDHQELMKPLLTCWLDTVVKSVIALPEDSKRRLFVINDELVKTGKSHALLKTLNEGRKYGLSFIAGFQNISDLERIYHQEGARSLINCFNTKVFFRNTDPQTNQMISHILGEAESIDVVEHYSYGSHEMRDGTNLNYQKKVAPLLLPSELATLPDLSAYLVLPGNHPIAKIKYRRKKLPTIAIPFDLKDSIVIKPKYEKTNPEYTHKEEKKKLINDSSLKIIESYVEQDSIILTLSDQTQYRLPFHHIPALTGLTLEEKKNFEWTDHATALYWSFIPMKLTLERILQMAIPYQSVSKVTVTHMQWTEEALIITLSNQQQKIISFLENEVLRRATKEDRENYQVKHQSSIMCIIWLTLNHTVSIDTKSS